MAKQSENHLLSPLEMRVVIHFCRIGEESVDIATSECLCFDRDLRVTVLNAMSKENDEKLIREIGFAVLLSPNLRGVMYRTPKNVLKIALMNGNILDEDNQLLVIRLKQNLSILAQHKYTSVNQIISMVML
jgi:hypothetical protein